MKLLWIGYILISLILIIFSYCFVDLNLLLLEGQTYQSIQSTFQSFLHNNRFVFGIVYIFIVISLFLLYTRVLYLTYTKRLSGKQLRNLLLTVVVLLLITFPAFSYDIFNYIATAKVTYVWKENPWITMPIDIPNEPALAYTRAANKVALYGPTWIMLTALPHFLGFNNVWLTIIFFKGFIALFYLAFLFLLHKKTKNLFQVSVFAFNPLILLEVIVGGHNDITMMLFALWGFFMFKEKKKIYKFIGILLWFLSIFVKGATLVLIPIFFIKKDIRKLLFIGLLCMFVVFLLTPFREEMYPWYAVWFLTILSFLPYKDYKTIYEYAIALSVGLIFRHAPYIFMGYYEGYGPQLRIVSMIAPVALLFIYKSWGYFYLNRMKEKSS